MQEERRKCLILTSPQDPSKVQSSYSYYLLVREQMTAEEKIYEEISNYLLEELGFNQQQFQECQEVYMTSPQYQQKFFLAMNSGDEENAKEVEKEEHANLKDIEKIKEMFIFSEVLKFESAIALENKMKSADSMEVDLAVEAMIMQLFMKDKFYLVFQVEEEELFKAIKKHKLQEDPEVRAKIMDNIKHLPPDVMQKIAAQLVHGGSCHNDSCSGEAGAKGECKNECCNTE